MDQQKIGRHLAEKRKEKSLTQAQLAELLGVSDRSVSRWENGVTMPDVSLFQPLCAALDMTLDEFLSGENAQSQPQPQVSVRHMEGYARYLTARSRRRTMLLAAALALTVLTVALLATLCLNRTFFTGRYDSEFLSGVTIPVPRFCLYDGTGGMDEYTVKLKTLRQTDGLDVWITSYLAGLKAISYDGSTVWYDAAQGITILQYHANNDGIGFVNTVYITYHAGMIPGL